MILRLTFWIALFCLLPPALHAQSTETEIKTRLINKPLYLRGVWADNTLRFDPSGHLLGTAQSLPFTLCGFELKKIRVEQDKLVIEGLRVGLELADGRQKRVTLRKHGTNERIHIEVAASSDGNYGTALDAIFADGLADMVPAMPSYWKSYAQKNFLPAAANSLTPASTSSDPAQVASTAGVPSQKSLPPQTEKAHRVGGAIEPPKALHTVEPSIPILVGPDHYEGNDLVNVWVKPDGTVTHMSIIRPLGMGLDECALAAIQQYVFKPATQNGEPVLVEVNIEVAFSLYVPK
jgi:TonB family protein